MTVLLCVVGRSQGEGDGVAEIEKVAFKRRRALQGHLDKVLHAYSKGRRFRGCGAPCWVWVVAGVVSMYASTSSAAMQLAQH